MLSLDQLMTDVDRSVSRESGEDRARMLARLTDLFVGRAGSLAPEQVELFGAVMERFATAIETGARVELALRLAGLAQAPRAVVATLAHDEIAVARPLLTSSACLDDQTLMSVALARGRDHMLAICERPAVSPAVTDLLVHQGDATVRQAIAGNPGARFSPVACATLVDHARRDEILGELLADRTDLPPGAMRRLVEIAKDTAKQRLRASLPGAEIEIDSAVERSATAVGRRPGRAVAPPSPMAVPDAGRSGVEIDVERLARELRTAETLFAISAITGLSLDCLRRIFDERDNDLLLVIGKASGWSWGTVKAVLKLRDPGLTERHHFRRSEEVFDGLAAATAARVVHFLKMRETEGHLATSGSGQDRLSVA